MNQPMHHACRAHANPRQTTAFYVLVIGLLFVFSVPLTWHLRIPDFAQDYAAAWGVLHGYPAQMTTAHLLLACCPTLRSYGIVPQTAHPPSTTLISIPFALLPWDAARWAWLIIGWIVVSASWALLRLPPIVCLISLPYWSLALAIGTVEPLLFGLLTLAIIYEKRPSIAGAALGIAIALKVYPALLVLALVLDRRWRTVAWAVLAAGSLWLIAEWATAATLPWLAYVPINTALWVDATGNYSLVRVIHALVPTVPFMASTVLIIALFTIPLLPALKSGDIRPLVPVMLLASPISWSHYIGLLALHPLGKFESLCLLVSGTLLWAVGMTLIAPDGLRPLMNGLIFGAMLLAWCRGFLASSRALPPQQQAV